MRIKHKANGVGKMKEMRSIRTIGLMLQGAVDHVVARYLDPKNQAKGTHINVPPLEMYEWLIGEGREAQMAYRDGEGLDREIEECSDIILLAVMRIDQINRQKQKQNTETKG